MEAKYNISDKVMVYDNTKQFWEKAIIKNIRYNIPSSFDSHIYPILYDVLFLYNGRFSKGHFESSIKSM